MTTPEKNVENNNGNDEVLRIKGVLEKSIEESESQPTLLDSLKKLQHMDISVETLDITAIGKMHSRPIDSDAATSDHKGLRNTTEEKIELTKKRFRESYKELENMKQKRKIQEI
nr:transcription elongation factor, TFIIS/CRSP70 [Tanacetum cinerariifolium]